MLTIELAWLDNWIKLSPLAAKVLTTYIAGLAAQMTKESISAAKVLKIVSLASQTTESR